MNTIEIRCGNCGKKLLSYTEGSFRQCKSPLKRCKKCNTKYLDPRCYEIAVEGLPLDNSSIPMDLIASIIGGFLIYRGIHLLGMHQLGVPDSVQWMTPALFIFFGVVFLIWGIIDIIAIKTGMKARRFDRLRKKSETRMKDKNYAYELRGLGYPVPDKYL